MVDNLKVSEKYFIYIIYFIYNILFEHSIINCFIFWNVQVYLHYHFQKRNAIDIHLLCIQCRKFGKNFRDHQGFIYWIKNTEKTVIAKCYCILK